MKILLVDDHALFARSLAIALSDFSEIEHFVNTKDVEHIEEVIAEEQPDILLADINLGKLSQQDGLALTRRVLKQYPTQKVVILSGYDLPVYRKEAQRLGAMGFVNKEAEPEELLRILLVVDSGSPCFPQDDIIIENLTEAETQVLRLLAKGVKRREIAQRLFLSERTVSNHLQHIFEKLQVSSAVEAVTKSIKLGYIPTPFP